jgi:hypothetical protein
VQSGSARVSATFASSRLKAIAPTPVRTRSDGAITEPILATASLHHGTFIPIAKNGADNITPAQSSFPPIPAASTISPP